MRPCKTTVDYFPHYTAHGKTMFALENSFGNDGYAAWFKLLELLGRTPGHCYDMSKPIDKHYLSAYLRLEVSKMDAVLNMLADVEAIDGELFKHGLIWSDNFIKNLSVLYEKRKGDPPSKPVINGRNRVSDPGNEVKGARKPQTKLNKKNPVAIAIAKRLREVVLLRKNANITEAQVARWSKTISAMLNLDKIPSEQIETSLDWYADNWDGKYIPVIESASALRKKWGSLLTAMRKQKKEQESDWS